MTVSNRQWKYVIRVNGVPYGVIASSVDEAIIDVIGIFHRTWKGEINTIQRDAEREKYEPYNTNNK